MSNLWFYSMAGQKSGPIPFNKLQELALAGKLKPTDVVKPENSSSWVSAISVNDLIPQLQHSPVPAIIEKEPDIVFKSEPWDPILVATASLLLPPLGQFLLGQTVKSFVLFIMFPIALFIFGILFSMIIGVQYGLLFLLPLILSYFCASCADAFLLAKKIKSGSPIKDWEFFGKWSVYE